MGFVADIFGGGAARHAANVANVRAQATAQGQQAAGQTGYNQILNSGKSQYNNIIGASQQGYNQLVSQIPGVTAPFQPTIQAGETAAQQYQQDLPQLTAQYAPTQAQLSATPGYQFALNQGLESTQNAAAARGLGVSGAALKAASAYSTGLAQQTYAQDAGIYQQGQQIAANNLVNGMNAGTSAASASGNLTSGLQQAATGVLQTGQANASNLLQGAQQTATADYLNQYNTGANTSLTGDQMAVSGQLAYNTALANGIQAVTNTIAAIRGGSTSPPSPQPTLTSPTTTSSIPNSNVPQSLTTSLGAAPSAYGAASNMYGSNSLVLPGLY